MVTEFKPEKINQNTGDRGSFTQINVNDEREWARRVISYESKEALDLIERIETASDRVREFIFLDAGNKNERISIIKIYAPSVSTSKVIRTYNYNQIGNNYILTDETTSLE
jgi:hypothetical protein